MWSLSLDHATVICNQFSCPSDEVNHMDGELDSCADQVVVILTVSANWLGGHNSALIRERLPCPVMQPSWGVRTQVSGDRDEDYITLPPPPSAPLTPRYHAPRSPPCRENQLLKNY